MDFIKNVGFLDFISLPGAWNPLSLGGALKAWWSADDHGTALMTDDGDGVISSWTDKVGGIAVVATDTARPTWSANSFNTDRAGLTFDGAANCFVDTTAFPAVLPIGSTARSVWAVASTAPSEASMRIISYGSAASAAATVRIGTTLGKPAVNIETSNATGSAFWDGPIVIGGIFENAVEPIARINGTAITGFSGAPTISTNTVRLRIGANTAAAAGAFWSGVIRSVCVTTQLSAGQRDQLEGFLAYDAGIASLLPASHPYRDAAP